MMIEKRKEEGRAPRYLPTPGRINIKHADNFGVQSQIYTLLFTS